MSNRLIILISIVYISCNLYSSDLKVSVFNNSAINNAVITIFEGEYDLVSNEDIIYTLKKTDIIYVSLLDNKFSLRTEKSFIGNFKQVVLLPSNDKAYFRIKPILPKLKGRFYDDGLELKIDYNKILFVNNVSFDNYLAGVVRTECGLGWPLEFYKAQACMARTYAIKNKQKHLGEGFFLCDGTHCQAYYGRSNNPTILSAVKETHQEVIIYNKQLITAVFHANCGGQTQNSDYVWVSSKEYLKSVQDPFCLNSRGSKWEETIKIDEWKNYLKSKGFESGNLSDNELLFKQNERKKNYVAANDKLSLRTIRDDWGFRSTYFSVLPNGNTLKIKGRGYGHGVGLCQEGAMEMAKRGFKYKEIINYYFSNVRIVDYKEYGFGFK